MLSLIAFLASILAASPISIRPQAASQPRRPLAARSSDSTVLRQVYDSLFAVAHGREQCRARFGPPRHSRILAIRTRAQADQFGTDPSTPLLYVVVGDSIVNWVYPDVEFTFRAHQRTDTLVAVRATPNFQAIRLLVGSAPLPRVETSTTKASGFTSFYRSGDTTERARDFTPDSLLKVIYIRDTLVALEARRGFCGPGPYC